MTTELDRLFEDMEIDAYMDNGQPKIDIRFPNWRDFKNINVDSLKSQIEFKLAQAEIKGHEYTLFVMDMLHLIGLHGEDSSTKENQIDNLWKTRYGLTLQELSQLRPIVQTLPKQIDEIIDFGNLIKYVDQPLVYQINRILDKLTKLRESILTDSEVKQ